MQSNIQNTNEIPLVLHNGSNCDYHLIIKELPVEFEGQFKCIGENTEKNITFSAQQRKNLKTIKNDI